MRALGPFHSYGTGNQLLQKRNCCLDGFQLDLIADFGFENSEQADGSTDDELLPEAESNHRRVTSFLVVMVVLPSAVWV